MNKIQYAKSIILFLPFSSSFLFIISSRRQVKMQTPSEDDLKQMDQLHNFVKKNVLPLERSTQCTFPNESSIFDWNQIRCGIYPTDVPADMMMHMNECPFFDMINKVAEENANSNEVPMDADEVPTDAQDVPSEEITSEETPM